MNIPWKVSDVSSQALAVTNATPLSNSLAAVSAPVDVRGYDWVEFIITLTGNTGGAPDITKMTAAVEFGEASGPLAGIWYPMTSEAVSTTGAAPQVNYSPERGVAGATEAWRLTVPVQGQQMRVSVLGDSVAPNVVTSVTMYAYKRSF